MVRIRAFPSGTVGKPMPVASNPSSNSAREKANAVFACPTMIGMIGVSLAPVSKPAALRDARKYSVFFHRSRILSGSCSRMSNAAIQDAATDGGCEVENRNGRAR